MTVNKCEFPFPREKPAPNRDGMHRCGWVDRTMPRFGERNTAPVLILYRRFVTVCARRAYVTGNLRHPRLAVQYRGIASCPGHGFGNPLHGRRVSRCAFEYRYCHVLVRSTDIVRYARPTRRPPTRSCTRRQASRITESMRLIGDRRILLGSVCVETVAAVLVLLYGHLSLLAVAVLYWIDLLFLTLRVTAQQLFSRPVTDRRSTLFQRPFRLLAHKRGSITVTAFRGFICETFRRSGERRSY